MRAVKGGVLQEIKITPDFSRSIAVLGMKKTGEGNYLFVKQ